MPGFRIGSKNAKRMTLSGEDLVRLKNCHILVTENLDLQFLGTPGEPLLDLKAVGIRSEIEIDRLSVSLAN